MTVSNPTDPLDVPSLCAQELARRNWVLADEPSLFAGGTTFLQRVLARLDELYRLEPQPINDVLVRKAVVHVYCRDCLHPAMSRNGARIQSIAIQETIAYGWPVALKRCGDRTAAENATLHAVNQLWLHIDQCEPGSYLAYFTKILLREIGQEWRKSGRIDQHEATEADLPRPDAGTDDLDLGALDNFAYTVDTYRAVELTEARASLFKLLQECLKNPRWIHIVLAHFWAELNASEIARQLSMRVQQVHVEKFRAIERIEKCCRETLIAEIQLLLS